MSELVLPSEIPWEDLRGKDLEECLYWLVGSMGGKDLEWRLGGQGGGGTDQGRDLECFFYMAGPDGELTRQKWWVEVKGRGQTLEPASVKEAVLNASGQPDLDVLVVATNTGFSNPTRDWLKTWQRSHPRPLVRLWDRSQLEKLVTRHPEVVIRFFAHALSPNGRLEVARSRFWNYSGYSDQPTLRLLWKHRADLEWNEQSIIAVLVSELANGNIVRRPWALLLPGEQLLLALGNALVNLLYFCIRADQAGIEQRPYIKGVAYLTLTALRRLSTEPVARVFRQVWDVVEGSKYPEKVRELAIEPVLAQLSAEIRDVCVNDCSRVSSGLVELTEEERDTYWKRLHLPRDGSEEEEERKPILVIESHDESCNVGFGVDRDHRCPIIGLDEPTRNVEGTLRTIERIVRHRSGC